MESLFTPTFTYQTFLFDIDFQSKEDAENFIIEKNREIRLFGFEPRLNVGSEGYAEGGNVLPKAETGFEAWARNKVNLDGTL